MKRSTIIALTVLCGIAFADCYAIKPKRDVSTDPSQSDIVLHQKKMVNNSDSDITNTRQSFRLDTVISVLDNPDQDSIITLSDEELSELLKKYFSEENEEVLSK